MGWSDQNIIAELVIIEGTGGGLFVYNGTPAPGNPPVDYVTAPGVTTDPVGNALPGTAGGFTSARYSGGVAQALAALNSGQLALYQGPPAGYASGAFAAVSSADDRSLDLASAKISPFDVSAFLELHTQQFGSGVPPYLQLANSTTLLVGSTTPPLTSAEAEVQGSVAFINSHGGKNWVLPSADTTGATDAANANGMLILTGNVQFTTGDYYINAPILRPTLSTFAGCGAGTRIHAVAAFSGSYMTQLTAPASTYQTTMKDMTLIPGTLSGSTLSGPGGVQVDNTGWPGGTTTINGSTRHVLDNITVFNSAGDAFHLDNKLTDCVFTRLATFRSAGYGFYIGAGSGGGGVTDSHFSECVSGFAANHGFYVAGANNMFTNCKSFTSGCNFYTGIFGSTQCGFEITSALGSGNRNVFNACQAQQSGLHGFDLQTVDSVAVVGCESDSNGAATAGVNGAGINLNTATNCSIVGNVGAQFLIPGNQTYGIQHQAGASTGTWIAANAIYGSVVGFEFVAGSGFILIDRVATDFSQVQNQFRVGLIEMFPTVGVQAVAGGTTITPSSQFGTYPISLVANAAGVIIAPAAFGGQQMTIVNTSAAHTVTFAAAGVSNVADGVADVIGASTACTFTWDANTSLWYRTY